MMRLRGITNSCVVVLAGSQSAGAEHSHAKGRTLGGTAAAYIRSGHCPDSKEGRTTHLPRMRDTRELLSDLGAAVEDAYAARDRVRGT